MSIDFTHDDICSAAEAAWAAIERYGKRHGVCANCLGAYVVPDMLFHVAKNTIADELLPDYRAELDKTWESALAARNGRPSKPGLH